MKRQVALSLLFTLCAGSVLFSAATRLSKKDQQQAHLIKQVEEIQKQKLQLQLLLVHTDF